MSTPPDGLHELEYARHILEEVLGWPAKGNIEMMGDCLRSISKSRRITPVKAHAYMVRAIGLARKQQVEVNHFFFQSGGYTEMRPEKENRGIPEWKGLMTPEEEKALAEHKLTPEYKEAQQELESALERLGAKLAMK